jgi:hypothetical protein
VEVKTPPLDAVLRGLRRPGDETQFTRVLYSVAAGHPAFASGLVKALLDVARRTRPDAVARLGPVPDELTCRAEVVLRDDLGRLDLMFDGGPDFTLFVENKLFSGYGDEQVPRYLRALKLLPSGHRAGLIAATRDIPGYGEPTTDEPGWLGSVRWAHVLPAMRQLTLPAPLDDHWRLLLDLMYDEGDLGMTEPNTAAIEAWAEHATGREELAKLLRQVKGVTLEALRDRMALRYSGRPVESLADYHTFGKRGKVDLKHELTKSWIGFRIPAAETTEPGFLVQFSNYLRRPLLMIEARPFIDEPKPDERSVAATAILRQTPRIYEDRGAWGRSHEPDEWLSKPDVPAAVSDLIQVDVEDLVSSGIFDADVDEPLRARRGLLRLRRAHNEEE